MLEDKFVGCMLGLAIGDALGGHYEAQTPDWIARRFPCVNTLFANLPEAPWSYTDDTQMAIGVAEALTKNRGVVELSLCAAFVENYDPSRGYGRGARIVLQAMCDGEDYKFWSNDRFPGGSYGNGAAMRVAPVGLLFHDDLELTREHARLSALPTHVHPLGIEGAQLIAMAVAQCVTMPSFDRDQFFSELEQRSNEAIYQQKLKLARNANTLDDLRPLGNGIAAQDSVATAIGCFALSPHNYGQVIGNAILLGGDTDTIAAMAGSISGAFLGATAIPQRLVKSLEETRKGRSYIIELAKRLHACL